LCSTQIVAFGIIRKKKETANKLKLITLLFSWNCCNIYVPLDWSETRGK